MSGLPDVRQVTEKGHSVQEVPGHVERAKHLAHALIGYGHKATAQIAADHRRVAGHAHAAGFSDGRMIEGFPGLTVGRMVPAESPMER